ncbi:hypothetical protein C0991_004907 [Blastosporella zonata]|nr:hypothetical protein C0991_004907 [Blastosporella zonata]
MRFSTAIFAFAAAAVAFAADIQVLVGDTGLEFNPSSVTAQNGDNVIFEFRSKNHTVTQSTFAEPCTYMTTPTFGVNSGFQFINTTTGPFPIWNITIQNASAPLWFFCAQTAPADHCNAGMVFAINPTAEKSFAAFQSAAMSATPGPAPSELPLSGASSVAGVDPSAATATSAVTVAGVTTGLATPSTLSAQSGTPSSAADTNTNGAIRMGPGATGLLALAGLLAGLIL